MSLLLVVVVVVVFGGDWLVCMETTKRNPVQ